MKLTPIIQDINGKFIIYKANIYLAHKLLYKSNNASKRLMKTKILMMIKSQEIYRFISVNYTKVNRCMLANIFKLGFGRSI